MPKNPTYYWDACLFISVFAKENRAVEGENLGRDYIRSQIVKGEANLVTSSLTIAEVLRYAIGEENHDKFKNFLRLDNVDRSSTSDPIWELTHEIRDYYKKEKGKTLTTPDAVHLATAIALKVDEFHTFDQNNKGNRLALLPLSGLVCGKYEINICKPQMPGDLFNQDE